MAGKDGSSSGADRDCQIVASKKLGPAVLQLQGLE